MAPGAASPNGADSFGDVVDDPRKKATRKHNGKSSNRERKRFRSLMWKFRRDPDDLKPEERKALEPLFVEIPSPNELYDGRLQFKHVLDTAPDPVTAERQLAELRERTRGLGLDFEKLWTTYHNWKTSILNCFDGRCTSAAVAKVAKVDTLICLFLAMGLTRRKRGLPLIRSLIRRYV